MLSLRQIGAGREEEEGRKRGRGTGVADDESVASVGVGASVSSSSASFPSFSSSVFSAFFSMGLNPPSSSMCMSISPCVGSVAS